VLSFVSICRQRHGNVFGRLPRDTSRPFVYRGASQSMRELSHKENRRSAAHVGSMRGYLSLPVSPKPPRFYYLHDLSHVSHLSLLFLPSLSSASLWFVPLLPPPLSLSLSLLTSPRTKHRDERRAECGIARAIAWHV